MTVYNLSNWLLIGLLGVWLPGCGYRYGFESRKLPEGFDTVAVPIFENKTYEVGIEVEFTNAIVDQLQRSGVAQVVDKESADVVLRGTIVDMTVNREGINNRDSVTSLPDGTSLARFNRLFVTVMYELVRKSDQKVIWATSVNRNERVYGRAFITRPVLNTVNPLYDLSEKRNTLRLIARDTSIEAFDRLTEQF